MPLTLASCQMFIVECSMHFLNCSLWLVVLYILCGIWDQSWEFSSMTSLNKIPNIPSDSDCLHQYVCLIWWYLLVPDILCLKPNQVIGPSLGVLKKKNIQKCEAFSCSDLSQFHRDEDVQQTQTSYPWDIHRWLDFCFCVWIISNK